MKRYRGIICALLLAASSWATFDAAHVTAATTTVVGGTNGPLCNSGGYFTPASVTVTSGDTITFSVPANDPYAGGIQINGFPQGSFVVPRGGSVTTAALTADVSYQGTWPSALSCIKGSGMVAVQAASSPTPSPSPTPSSSTTTPTPTPSSSTTTYTPTYTKKSTTPTTSTTAPTPAATQPAAPETVVADTITVAGKKITSTQNLAITQSQPLVLAGTTVPNGKITLTVHSNPTTATVQADASGNWDYTITGLQPGNHTVEATVTDPATNQTSAPSKLLSFTVDAAPATPARATAKKGSWLPVLAMGAAVLLAATITVIIKMKKVKSGVSPAAMQPNASSQEAPQQTSSPNEPDGNANHKEGKV